MTKYDIMKKLKNPVWLAHAGPLTQKVSFVYVFADGA